MIDEPWWRFPNRLAAERFIAQQMRMCGSHEDDYEIKQQPDGHRFAVVAAKKHQAAIAALAAERAQHAIAKHDAAMSRAADRKAKS